MKNNDYTDTIYGVLYDQSNRPYFVFTRISNGPYQFFHLLAQTADGRVFILQKAEQREHPQKHFVITLERIDGELLELIPLLLREPKQGALGTWLACVTQRNETLGRFDSLPETYWHSLDAETLDEFASPKNW